MKYKWTDTINFIELPENVAMILAALTTGVEEEEEHRRNQCKAILRVLEPQVEDQKGEEAYILSMYLADVEVVVMALEWLSVDLRQKGAVPLDFEVLVLAGQMIRQLA